MKKRREIHALKTVKNLDKALGNRYNCTKGGNMRAKRHTPFKYQNKIVCRYNKRGGITYEQNRINRGRC